MGQTSYFRVVTARDLEERGRNVLGKDFWERKPSWIGGNISDQEACFLAGLVHFAAPTRIVEIGVASGWSSAVLLRSGVARNSATRVTGIDLSPTFYIDAKIATGAAVQDVVPDLLPNYRLLTGRFAFDAMEDAGSVDFAFIDGHHKHPWATIDLLSVLPFMEAGRWVALHDLHLCSVPKNDHVHRGPYYLYNLWPGEKIHAEQSPSQIGAFLLEQHPSKYLSAILEILYTPWEIRIPKPEWERLCALIERHYGAGWARELVKVYERNNK